MTEIERKASHKRPEFLERVEVGVYRVRGTELRIVQDGKQWKITGHEPVEGERFAKRQLAADKVQELGLVPAEQPAEAKPDPTPAKATTARKPRQRKETAKASA